MAQHARRRSKCKKQSKLQSESGLCEVTYVRLIIIDIIIIDIVQWYSTHNHIDSVRRSRGSFGGEEQVQFVKAIVEESLESSLKGFDVL